ncbi:hypothetical protein [uncultured Paraglaciecola sp.]|uniref:hypothetical protein n=1 Tax=uncultured Paraglaciecola sp. TaxID=1765024 RepID=UPI0026286472|nr:hypothetical protein [uncultured Paraglaciecola sp.]
MPVSTLTAEDTLTLYDRVIVDLADDDVSSLSFNNDLVAVKTGKNKNSIYAKNEMGNNATLTIRLIRGSSDDQFMNSKLVEMQKDFVATSLATGEFVKRLGDGQGNVIRDVYTMQGGTFTRRVDSKENVSGDTEQAVAIYTMVFANVIRSHQ